LKSNKFTVVVVIAIFYTTWDISIWQGVVNTIIFDKNAICKVMWMSAAGKNFCHTLMSPTGEIIT